MNYFFIIYLLAGFDLSNNGAGKFLRYSFWNGDDIVAINVVL